MKKQISILAVIIIILSLVATCTGIFSKSPGEPTVFYTMHGEKVTLQGVGLYRFDTVSYAAQAVAQDWVSLLLGIPLLITGLILYRKNSLSGKLVLAGALGYFLYTYTSLTFLAAYNPLFLVYVALFSTSLFSFIFIFKDLDVELVFQRCSRKFPRKATISFLLFLALFLLAAWLGRIIPALISGTSPVGLEAYTTLVIQAMDLGLIVPASLITAYLLWINRPWGYTLALVLLVKGVFMGTALVAMMINMVLNHIPVSPVESILFSLIPFISGWIAYRAIKSVQEG